MSENRKYTENMAVINGEAVQIYCSVTKQSIHCEMQHLVQIA